MKRAGLNRLFAGMMTAVLVMGFAFVPVGKVGASSLKLSKKTLSLKVGKTIKLKVKGKFSGKIKWLSSRKKIATVSKKGKIKGIKAGKATIFAKAGGIKLKCSVTVVKDTIQAVPETPHGTEATAASDVNVITENPVQTVDNRTEGDVATPIPETYTPATEMPEETPEPTQIPEPTATPKYMQEGAFVYEALDVSWIDPNKPMVAFTFDDGPVGTKNTDYSIRILNTLKEYGMHATFNYITGIINNNNRGEIIRAMEDGNEIGNHTTGYDSLSNFSASKIAEEVEKARKTLEEITGISSFTLRPPNLALNNDVYKNVPVPLIGCNVYSLDWEGKSTQDIINNVKNAKDGDIVLMHETCANTAPAVEYLVPYFVDKGYQIVSVAELYAVKDIPMFRGNYYKSTTSSPDRPTN